MHTFENALQSGYFCKRCLCVYVWTVVNAYFRKRWHHSLTHSSWKGSIRMRQPRNINLVRDSIVPINRFQLFERLQPFTCGQKTFYAFTNVNDRKRIRVDGAIVDGLAYEWQSWLITSHLTIICRYLLSASYLFVRGRGPWHQWAQGPQNR